MAKTVASLAALAILIAACAGPRNFEDACIEAGFQPDTDPFRDCVRKKNEEARMRDTQQYWNPQFRPLR